MGSLKPKILVKSYYLRGRIRSVLHNDTTKLSRATKFMVNPWNIISVV